jgi:hypothetical protein
VVNIKLDVRRQRARADATSKTMYFHGLQQFRCGSHQPGGAKKGRLPPPLAAGEPKNGIDSKRRRPACLRLEATSFNLDTDPESQREKRTRQEIKNYENN